CCREQRDPGKYCPGFALLGGHRLGVVVGRENRHVTTAATFGGELHRAGRRGEQGVVAAQADDGARVEFGAALTHEDVARPHALAAELLHATWLRLAVATVTRRPAGFLVSHLAAPLLSALPAVRPN